MGANPIHWKWINTMIDRFILSIFLFVLFLSLATNLSNQVSVVEWAVCTFSALLQQKQKKKTQLLRNDKLNTTFFFLIAVYAIVFAANARNWFVCFLEAVCAHARAHTHFSQTVKSAKLICFVIRFESRSILDCIMASFRFGVCVDDGALCAAKWRWLNGLHVPFGRVALFLLLFCCCSLLFSVLNLRLEW